MEFEQPPIVEIQTSVGPLHLHWFNTKMRTYDNDMANHVEYRDEETGELRGLRVGEAVMDQLFELDFPYQYDPVVDPATEQWLVNLLLLNLDAEPTE